MATTASGWDSLFRHVAGTAGLGGHQGTHRSEVIDPIQDQRLRTVHGSLQCNKATTIEKLRDSIALALTYDEMIVVEEAAVGKEIEVAVLGNLEP